MVMEASPSPQSVGREFVRQYYTLLNKAPAHLHRFYNNYSSFVHGGLDAPTRETLPVVGQKQIHNRIQQLNFRNCHAKISQVDSQATLGNGVVVQVTGELSNDGAPMRRFTQTFVLAAQSPKKYYVHNDIFRYQDIVFSDEEGEGEPRSEGEEEERSYFPPPPSAFPPAAFPPAPPASVLPQMGTPPHLNGLGGGPPAPSQLPVQPNDDTTRQLVAALQASSIPTAVAPELEVEPELVSVTPTLSSTTSLTAVGSTPTPTPTILATVNLDEDLQEEMPEVEREPTPPPPQPAALPVAPEPKTYANRLKSAVGVTYAQPAPRTSSQVAASQGQNVNASSSVTSTAPRPASASSPPESVTKPQRSQRLPRNDTQPSPAGDGGPSIRRYSDNQQLFLGNLPHNATEEELRTLFGRFGTIAELRVHSKPAATGGPRHPNYGFITYEEPQAAQNCLNAGPLYFPADSTDGVKLNVEEKKARGGRNDTPRGGRGGPARGPPSHRPPFPSRPPYRR